MKEQEDNKDIIRVGNKDLKNYLSAYFFASSNDKDTVQIIARGHNIKTAVDIAAILIREYVENPKYEVVIGSEKFGERFVSTIDITIKGKRLDGKFEPVRKDKVSEE